METIVPEARGRAEALRTFLAGGGVRVGRRYTQGKLKGKTIEQAQVLFDRKWAGASGGIKDKYANMAGNGAMSPSERADYETRVAGVRRTPTPAPMAEAPNPNKDLPTDERMHAEGKVNKPPAAPRLAQAKPAGLMEVAQESGDTVTVESLQRQRRLREMAQTGTQAPREAQTKPAAPVSFAMNTPTIDKLDFVGAAMTPMQQAAAARAKQKPYNFGETAVGKAVSQITNPETVYNRPVAGTPVTGDPNKDLPLDERMKMQGKVNAPRPVAPVAQATLPTKAPPATPQEPIVAGVAPSPPREIAFDGSRNMTDSEMLDNFSRTGKRVNSLTGLPSGYRPGDALPAGADQAMKDAAAASVARQAAAVPTPQPKPMIQGVTKAPPTPGGPSLEEGWARDRRNEANKAALDKRIAANGNMGLKAGPIRPLAELADPRALKPLAKPAPRVVGSKYSFARRV